jgi:hypothetical protein
MKLKAILKGENGHKETKVDGDKATISHVTLNKATESHYQMEWGFDFTDVTREELIRMATAHLAINITPGRAAFKKLTAAEIKEQGDSWAFRTYSVREYLDKQPERVPVKDKVARLVESGKITAADLREMLATIGADEEESE